MFKVLLLAVVLAAPSVALGTKMPGTNVIKILIEKKKVLLLAVVLAAPSVALSTMMPGVNDIKILIKKKDVKRIEKFVKKMNIEPHIVNREVVKFGRHIGMSYDEIEEVFDLRLPLVYLENYPTQTLDGVTNAVDDGLVITEEMMKNALERLDDYVKRNKGEHHEQFGELIQYLVDNVSINVKPISKRKTKLHSAISKPELLYDIF